MRMRQSIGEIERAFVEEIALDRTRRERLQETTRHRSRRRSITRERKRSSFRFGVLIFSMIATAVIVTIVMFKTLALLLG